MSHSSIPGEPKSSLPDDIALAAGLPHGAASLPHGDETARSLHDISDRARSETRTTAGDLRHQAGDLADDAQAKAEGYADRAKEAALDARDTVKDKAESLIDRASETYDDARDWASDTHRSTRRSIGEFAERGSQRLDRGKTNVEQFVTENPLLVGVVGLAAGLLLGALLPRTRREDETVGPWADEVKDQGIRYARDFADRGREFVESALDPENLNAATQGGSEPFRKPDVSPGRSH
ncbi:YtxH domain-containing protein [Methylobacterium sp. 88A]|uniref:YtxH domain-containing protein n=1 Tax=Methylobacterium sp. 88A TaxID=1131813 RepID=UPI000366D25D|nr:YtxH domain-containing protein [Methylobacterium sp. 88A]